MITSYKNKHFRNAMKVVLGNHFAPLLYCYTCGDRSLNIAENKTIVINKGGVCERQGRDGLLLYQQWNVKFFYLLNETGPRSKMSLNP